ncbi:MAG: phenylacetate-CoA oxygenase subunit PaaC [Chitinophagaceae bacterium]|nr:phenylacetate-CoA oxygenase subunit PaaC [Chitinophagaceae bacterium]
MNNPLINYLLHLADTTLILSHRNSEWCGHGPILEQDIALTNISLDLLGQARLFYQYAAQLINESKKAEGVKAPSPQGERVGDEVNEDTLAYLRTERQFKNLLLAEQPNSDWGQTILRQYLYSQFQQLLFQQLQHHNDEHIAAIATKSLKETNYHVRWSSEWVIRLGDGTAESKQRMLHAINELWCYTGEMFIAADYELHLNIDFNDINNRWTEKVNTVFAEAALILPSGGGGAVFMQTGGKTGTHTEHLGYILADLQYLQRAYPNSQW